MHVKTFIGNEIARFIERSNARTLAIEYSPLVSPEWKINFKLKDKNKPHKKAARPKIEKIIRNIPLSL